MGARTVAEKLAAFSVIVFVLVALASCSSNHRVSPWGGGAPPPLSAFAAPADLDAQIEAIEAETAALKLVMTVELRGKLPRGGGEIVVRGYEGKDIVGRTTHAVRAATARGIVMAVGPKDAADHATELVPALVPVETGRPEDGAYRSLTDLNSDGALDVVLRGRGGALEVHRITDSGSAQYVVDTSWPPVDAADVDADGLIDLLARAPVDEKDPIKPVFIEVATFDRGGYRTTTGAAIAYHKKLAEPPKPRSKDAAPKEVEDDATRLRRALERAWHALLAGDKRDEILAELRKQSAPAELRASFDAHVARLEALAIKR